MSPTPPCIRDISKTGRTEAQLRNHYLVEKSLADRLRASSREERIELFPKLYDELFARVLDHPRLQRRESEEESRRSVAARMAILRESLTPETVFMEIAPGDCRLACEVAKHAKTVYAADISDQRAPGLAAPSNFHMVVFDGLHLDVAPASVDIAFSYQFLEHLHPDDVGPHFDLVSRALKPGGLYILDTPHAYSGPHDISRYFSRTADAFHMHEWTYGEIRDLGRKHGFDRMSVFRFRRRWDTPLALMATLAAESALGSLPVALRWRLSQRAFMGVTACLRKGL
ncbi:MAG: class I SAM-dependent methyltransferase [Prosthecobacter sp.]|nr:class I SAM-dependent methyltransferase [Prosthecobacter sp.]